MLPEVGLHSELALAHLLSQPDPMCPTIFLFSKQPVAERRGGVIQMWGQAGSSDLLDHFLCFPESMCLLPHLKSCSLCNLLAH